MTLCMNQGAAATTTMGIHLWIWMLQMHNADILTIILDISRTNIQHAIFAARKGISQVIITLQRRKIILQNLHSLSINRKHQCITSIRPLGNHQILLAH